MFFVLLYTTVRSFRLPLEYTVLFRFAFAKTPLARRLTFSLECTYLYGFAKIKLSFFTYLSEPNLQARSVLLFHWTIPFLSSAALRLFFSLSPSSFWGFLLFPCVYIIAHFFEKYNIQIVSILQLFFVHNIDFMQLTQNTLYKCFLL